MEKLNGELEMLSKQLAEALFRQFKDSETGGKISLFEETEHFLTFSNDEVAKMPKQFKKTFRAEGQVIHYRKKKSGKYSFTYEARYRRHGYNISVAAQTIKRLKERFIEAIQSATPGVSTASKVPTTFHSFAIYYFNTFRVRKVVEKTLQNDLKRYNRYLRPTFNEQKLKSISPGQCQAIIDDCINDGHGKTAAELYSLLNQIFKMAIAHGIILKNPLSIVVHDAHESVHGKALTKDEEKKLLEDTAGTPYQLMFAVILYAGLRPNEYKSVRIESDFIIAVNSKRKNKRIEYKRIPISPMLRPFVENVSEIKFYSIMCLRRKMYRLCPGHKLYDLRTTFYTRCQECGVAEVARKKFAGHSLGKLADAYTDVSDDYLKAEAEKLNY